jgi:hypothetical protein
MANWFPAQGIIYASTSAASNPKSRLEAAISALISSYPTTQNQENIVTSVTQIQSKILFSVYYEQTCSTDNNTFSNNVFSLASPSVDLAFDDSILDNVKDSWETVMGLGEQDQVENEMSDRYMVFEDREPMNGNDDD